MIEFWGENHMAVESLKMYLKGWRKMLQLSKLIVIEVMNEKLTCFNSNCKPYFNIRGCMSRNTYSKISLLYDS